jgi:hypothetical protein
MSDESVRYIDLTTYPRRNDIFRGHFRNLVAVCFIKFEAGIRTTHK